MSQTKTFTVRATLEEIDRWRAAAGDQKFNSWVKRSLNDAAELDAALEREREEKLRERQLTMEKAFPQQAREKGCPKWPEFCYRHAMKHV